MAPRSTKIILATIAPVLLTGGIAVAASQGTTTNQAAPPAKAGKPAGRPGPPPGPPGPGVGIGADLTYGELHVRRDGKDVVIRIDRGKVKATSDTSITVTENDGNDVTIPVDANTKILRGPGAKNTKVTDLKVGTGVIVEREAGQAAKTIGVPPPPGSKPPRPPHGPPPAGGKAPGAKGPGGPPAGAPQGQGLPKAPTQGD